MTRRVRAMVSVLLPLLAVTVNACTTNDPAETAMRDDEDEIRHVRNSEFSGPRLRMFLTLKDGSRASVNTADDAVQTRPGVTPVPGHRARDWTFVKEVKAGTTIAHALVSWDPDDPDDYLMAGWWIQFPGQHLPELDLTESEQYAIVDGPEIDPANPPELPVTGMATYTGNAGGVYAYVPEGDKDAAVIDEYQGTITIGANFADRTVSGCIGCVGDLSTGRTHFGVILGQAVLDDRSLIADYELHLGAASIDPNGTFETADVTVRHPTRTVAFMEGFWGGAFSNIPDGDGNPRLATGFSSAVFAESDGSEASIAAAFVALTDRSRGR